MGQSRYLQMVRTNRFELVYKRWKERKLTQAEAAEQGDTALGASGSLERHRKRME